MGATSTEDAGSLVSSSIVKSSEASLRLVRKLTTVSVADHRQFTGEPRDGSTGSEIRVQDETCSDGRLGSDHEIGGGGPSPWVNPETDLQTPSQLHLRLS